MPEKTADFDMRTTDNNGPGNSLLFQIWEGLAFQAEASGIDIKLKGGLLKPPPPVKTCLGTILTRILHRKGWGIKITQEKFVKWVLRPKSTIFAYCLLEL